MISTSTNKYTTFAYDILIIQLLKYLNRKIFAVLSHCFFGYCQWFGCPYLLWCYVPYFCGINCEALLGSCWSSTFCQIPSSTTPCFHAFLSIIPFFILLGYSGSFTAFHISVSLICAAILFTYNIFCFSSSIFVLFWSTICAPSRTLSILFWALCIIVTTWFFGSYFLLLYIVEQSLV